MDVPTFYDRFAPYYDLVFSRDFDTSIALHGRQLAALIRQNWGVGLRTILDVSCGIGTQALGLAQQGFQVTASDLSPGAIARARTEAAARNLAVAFSVADMRCAHTHHQRRFDLVLSADNSIPHLLSDAAILTAFRQFYACCKPGGGCIVTVRDYEHEDRTNEQIRPYGIKVIDGTRYLLFQVWRFDGPIYELSMYLVEDSGQPTCRTEVFRTRYYAITIDRLIDLMRQAGFDQVDCNRDGYVQPAIIGKRNS